ncbi:uncharacterized protein [Anabrus simplex]|uniref:uncharacterized protein isoform X2 n=1 Tax=Anabrus simplex TaxID=316456 RepID=UPI0035A35719
MAVRKKMCYVRGCPTEDNEPGIRFFHFPRTEDRFSKWVEFCKNDMLLGKSRLECSNHFICSRHFPRDAFQNELLLKLNRNSYPTLLPPPPTPPHSPSLIPHSAPLHHPVELWSANVIKQELSWQSLAPTCRGGVSLPDDEKVFQIASALKAHRDELPWSCDAEDVDTLLMGLSEWENIDTDKRKYYFNRALTLYKAVSKGEYSTTGDGFYSGDSEECEVSSSREEVYEATENCEDSASDSSPSHPHEVTVVCVAFM